MADPAKPSMKYWHVFTNEEGTSEQQQFEVTKFKLKGVGPDDAPQWNDKMDPAPSVVTFKVLPGRWFVETMDGHRVEMGPGELMMGEDQNTKERDGRKGHLSGTVGDEPCTMIVTGLDVTPTVKQPGRFK